MQYGLEHWIKGLPLKKVVTASWKWQPGWFYFLGLLDKGLFYCFNILAGVGFLSMTRTFLLPIHFPDTKIVRLGAGKTLG